jgi:hypothetical protein|tara:strand:- start:7028 stop:7483 length:456 start_codon:yes stop_codon:yes gene_type:complete
MTGFYNVTKKIKDALAAEPFVNTVSFGSLDDIDLNKQTIFPLSHIIVNNCNVGSNTMTFNISILAMDIVDESKDEVTDIFVGNDNEQDVLNTQLEVLNRVLALLQRGDLYTDLFQVEGAVGCEPFVDRFENKLAGWAATFDVIVQNDMTVC